MTDLLPLLQDFYRDKLAMRMGARAAGFRVPEFCRVLNYDELRAYMATVPSPWLGVSRLIAYFSPSFRIAESAIASPASTAVCFR